MTYKGSPFFFDTNVFDPDDPRYTPNEHEKPKLEYSQDQLKQAKEASFEAGKIAGFKESQASLMQDIQRMVQKIERDVSTLFAAEEDRNSIFEAEAVNLALSIFRKTFPVYAEAHGVEEIKSVISAALVEHKDINRIILEVAPSLQAGLQDFIEQSSLKERMPINANPSLNKQACKILWENGGITYDMQQIAHKIEKTLQEALAVHGINSHDNAKETKEE